jgi:hypothetical protein
MKLKFLGYFLILPYFSYASMYEPDRVWDKKRISVCFPSSTQQFDLTEWKVYERDFEIGDFSQEEKLKIKEIVNLNFTVDRTGIHFIGWEDCDSLVSADIMIFKADDKSRKVWFKKKVPFKGISTIGQHKESKFKASTVFSKVTPQTVVHEFGHASSLRHEHVHPNYRGWLSELELKGSAIPLTDYDYDSVMNTYVRRHDGDKKKCSDYCLSEKDLITLKTLYK